MADEKNFGKGSKPPVTVKGNGGPSDSKTEITENEKNCARESEFKICSPNRTPVTSPQINPVRSAQSKFSILTHGILKPPQLSVSNDTTPSILTPSQLDPSYDKESKNSLVNGKTPIFVPLVPAEVKKTSSPPSAVTRNAISSSFIFGQNVQDRFVNNDKCDEVASTSLSLNDMLFTNAVKKDGNSIKKESKLLIESAKEYEKSRAVKRKYEEIEVVTGEENETNILQIYCKLFAFDKGAGSWQERGRGVLRLNDFDGDGRVQSRLVFRTTGIWRVVLNTKVWAEMSVEQAGEKSVRFTALDPQGVVKVFLVMASIDDSRRLYTQMKMRILQEMSVQKVKSLERAMK